MNICANNYLISLTFQSGIYICSASSPIGTVFAQAKIYVQEPSVIVKPPESVTEVSRGESLTLGCAAEGRPKPLVLWMHEEERNFLSPGDRTDSFEVI